MFVIKREHWLVRHQNLLIEMFDPKKPLTSYRFEFIIPMSDSMVSPKKLDLLIQFTKF